MYCDICEVSLNSHEQRISHQKGKTHQKRLSTRQRAEELLKNGSSVSRHCEICNVTLTSEITALDHFEGKNHKKKERALEKHNGCKLHEQCCDLSELAEKLSVDERRCCSEFKSNSIEQRKHHSVKRLSVNPVPCAVNKMNGYSTMDEFPQSHVQSKASLALVNGETPSGAENHHHPRRARCAPTDEHCSGNGQRQHQRYIDHDIFQSTSTNVTCYSNGYENETVSLEANAGMGPLTVGFGRPSVKPQTTLHCLDEEVQSPTKYTFQFHSTSVNEDVQQLEIENRLLNAIVGIGSKYWSLKNIAGELPVNISREKLHKALVGLEMKCIIHRERNNPLVWRTVTQSQDQAATKACPTSSVDTKVAYFLDLQDKRASSSNGIAEVLSPTPQFGPAISRSFQGMKTTQTHLSCTKEHSTLHQPTSMLCSNRGRIFPEAEFPLIDRGDSYIDAPLSPVLQEAFGYNSGMSFENLNGFAGHVNEDSTSQQTVSLSPPFSPPPVSPLSPCHRSSTVLELQQGIIRFLRDINRPSRALDVSKAVGLTSKKDVNSLLYQLERMGVVYKMHDTQPPMWVLSPPKRRSSCGPGVIGEERRRSTNGYDEKLSSSVPFSRSHSSNGVVNLGEVLYPDGLQSTARRENARPRARSFGPPSSSSSQESFLKYCEYCKVPLNSSAQTQEHLKSTKHRNKLAKMVFRDYPTFCEYCKVHLNSESQATEHFSSSRHEQTVAKSQKAPAREHPDLRSDLTVAPNAWTSTTPYSYQLELYTKAMMNNSVCFLPTGTGKTLVSALVIAHMLNTNPTRQVVFLVDRVLLVLQQSEYLKKELADIMVQDPKRGERSIRIGAVCGEMRKLEHGARIYEHDLLVITADCYRNHLNNGTLRFEDVSLIVLDEAHHCNKDHPYNVIVRDYYLGEFNSQHHRPKILGLTASPAGETNLERTVKKLQRLLTNLGGATLLTVTENVRDLQEKTSRARLVCLCTEYTSTESQLLDVLIEYSTKCFNLAVRVSELKDYKDIFQPPAGALLSSDDIYSISRVIDNIMILSRTEGNALNSLLHLQSVCDAVCTLQECGETTALDGLLELLDDGTPHGFDWAETMGLPCSILKSSLEQLLLSGARKTAAVSGIDSGVGELVEQLLKLDWERAPSQSRPRPIALVLVKRRRTAHCLVKYLSNCAELCWRGVSTACIVGHGARSTDGGMSVNKQKEIISHIREGKYQVVVATSVAEEGLDLPVCELVIQMDPPSSVTALVQIRGRARHKDAVFVAICRDEEQAKRIQDLLKREENMQQAACLINGM